MYGERMVGFIYFYLKFVISPSSKTYLTVCIIIYQLS